MTVVGPLVGFLVAAAALLVAWPGRRPSLVGGAAVPRSRRGRLPHPGRRRTPPDEGRLAAALVEAAAVLRTGVPPAEAWRIALGVPAADRVPTVAQLAAVAPGRGAPLGAVVAAARVADELGAPLAAVLEQVAAAIAARSEAAADVEAALAGPRSSARVLVWLPVFGVVLGTALGADPVSVLLGGGIGSAAGATGVVLQLVGQWWTGALLRRAARAGADP